tara:strand:+ start:948 stop:1298 length:351 start_codon:yes stop_codon:yes gene_type:complete
MNRSEFGSKLKTHDWYYAYSDDHSVWRRGRDASARLRRTHEELECPFDMGILNKWAHNMILEQFAEEAPGEWYRQPRKYKCVAPAKREDLITQAQHDEITNWMTLGATVEQIAKIA